MNPIHTLKSFVLKIHLPPSYLRPGLCMLHTQSTCSTKLQWHLTSVTLTSLFSASLHSHIRTTDGKNKTVPLINHYTMKMNGAKLHTFVRYLHYPFSSQTHSSNNMSKTCASWREQYNQLSSLKTLHIKCLFKTNNSQKWLTEFTHLNKVYVTVSPKWETM
jgi:hypothetical protein